MAVADPDEGILSDQVTELMAICRPEPRSFLDALLQRPAEAARVVARRLNESGPGALTINLHDLDVLTAEQRQTFIRVGAVACLEADAIGLLGGIGEYLRPITGEHGLSALQLLLTREVVEVLLVDAGNLDAAAAHVIATTFEHCLGGNALDMAVESFFAEWESNHAERRTDAIDEDEDPMDAWQDCLVEHDELRPEACVQRSTKEQQQILKEMFGDEWTEEEDAQIVEASATAACEVVALP